MRYLGIDYGTKRVGTALSDEAGMMGFPHKVLPNDEALSKTLLALIATEGVGTVVIGDSKNLSQEKNSVAKEAEAFGQKLAEESGVPVLFHSELYTTQEARRGFTGEWEKKKDTTDASAAALILTSYLSSHHG